MPRAHHCAAVYALLGPKGIVVTESATSRASRTSTTTRASGQTVKSSSMACRYAGVLSPKRCFPCARA